MSTPFHIALDHGLIPSALWQEWLLADLAARPAEVLLGRGRAAPLDPEALAYDAEALTAVKAARAAGRETVLVAPADAEAEARAVAAHLGLFDRVETAGAAAAEAFRPAPKGRLKGYVKALRPHQWLKNILIFLPILAAHDLSAAVIVPALFAFVAFSLAASSVYVLNDLLDLAADRAHPRKRRRPFASGAVPLGHGLVLAPGLLVLAFGLALLTTPLPFVLVLLGYYIATLAYSFVLKRQRVIDICMLAGLYTMRVIAGTEAAALELSTWMLAFSVFLFLSLAAVKRQAELVDAAAREKPVIPGRGYAPTDLPVVEMMAIAAGYNAVLVLALYISSPDTVGLYLSPTLLWGACPVLLYWISRMVMVAHKGGMDDDPLIFAVRDRVSQGCGVLVLACGLAATFL